MAQAREVEVKFRRDLGLLDITMIGLGPTIGTTIFLLVGPDEGALTKLFAVVAAGLFIALNYRGTKLTGRSETAVTIVLVAVVVTFIIAGLLHLANTGLPPQNFQPFFRGNTAGAQFLS